MNTLQTTQLKSQNNPQKGAIVEIRAGTGGNEAAIFVGDLVKMYTKFIESNKKQGLSLGEHISSSSAESGGYKEFSFKVKGKDAFSMLQYESGVHRVQRVPETETKGRVHTSTATVAVLPVAEGIDVIIKPEDTRIDVYHSSGKGGQSVNTTDSAVRITHLSTGVVATCQTERSQSQNKEKAMTVLKARILGLKIEKQAKARADQRRTQIGSGDRSEKIRTYNFSQNRVTDHRIKKSWHNLDKILNGQLNPIIQALIKAQDDKTKNQGTDE